MFNPGQKPDQLTICTRHCGARCCRYITVSFPAPRGVDDWDEVRWWLAHEGTLVTKDEDGWMLHMMTRCRNLRDDNTCGVYPHHMIACKDYDPKDCEFTGPVPFEVELKTEDDLAAYIERRRLKRAVRVAQDIRRAAGVRTSGAALVQIQGLA